MYRENKKAPPNMKFIKLNSIFLVVLLGLFVYVATHPTVIQTPGMSPWLGIPKSWGITPPPPPPPAWYSQPAWWGVILSAVSLVTSFIRRK
jgi:hypothetical protein